MLAARRRCLAMSDFEQIRGMGRLCIPLIDVPVFNDSPRSPRCRSRRSLLLNAIRVANGAIVALNDLSSSGYARRLGTVLRDRRSPDEVLNERWLNLKQSKAVQQRIFRISYSYCRRQAQHLRVNDYDSILAELFSSSYSASSTLPEFVDPNRISIPAKAGQVDLLSNLSPHLQKLYQSPSNAILLDPPPAVLPPACTLVKRSVYPELVTKLFRAGLVELIDDPVHDSSGNECINGFFGIAKPDGTQRFILDMRRGSAFFLDPPFLDLPTADRLAGLLPPGWALSVFPLCEAGKRDIDNFFFRFRAPRWMIRYMAIKPIRVSELGLTEQELRQHHLNPNSVLYPAFCVMAMGFSHSPALTQDAHENIIYNGTSLFKRSDALSRFNDLRIDRLRHMICLDDVIVAAPAQLQLVQPALNEYDRAVESAGLVVKHSKSVNATSEPIEALGTLFDGYNGLVTVSPQRAIKIQCATLH